MRTGFVSFDRWPYDESISNAAALGFDFLELMMDGDAHRASLAPETESIEDRLVALDLDLLVHFPYPLLIGSPHEYQRDGAVEEVKRCIDVAVELGAEKGILHPASYGWDRVWGESELAGLVTQGVRELDAYATTRDFEICVENLVRRGALDVNQLDGLLEQTDTSLTFDTGHAALAGSNEDSMAAFLAEHRGRVSHLHLNDNRHGISGYRGQDEHLPLGYGSLDFDTILEPLLTSGWDGTLSIELDTATFDYLEVSQKHLEQVLA
jgi:sugar phosphate isomerase/epimerase